MQGADSPIGSNLRLNVSPQRHSDGPGGRPQPLGSDSGHGFVGIFSFFPQSFIFGRMHNWDNWVFFVCYLTSMSVDLYCEDDHTLWLTAVPSQEGRLKPRRQILDELVFLSVTSCVSAVFFGFGLGVDKTTGSGCGHMRLWGVARCEGGWGGGPQLLVRQSTLWYINK